MGLWPSPGPDSPREAFKHVLMHNCSWHISLGSSSTNGISLTGDVLANKQTRCVLQVTRAGCFGGGRTRVNIVPWALTQTSGGKEADDIEECEALLIPFLLLPLLPLSEPGAFRFDIVCPPAMSHLLSLQHPGRLTGPSISYKTTTQLKELQCIAPGVSIGLSERSVCK